MRGAALGARIIVTEVNPVRAIEARMDGHDVMTMEEAAPKGDFFITATGCKNTIGIDHMLLMKDRAILANAGHFDVEIDMQTLKSESVEKHEVRENIMRYRLPKGNSVNVIGQGRLVNIAAADGHPAEIMDLSFAVQALSAIYIRDNHKKLENKVIDVSSDIDCLIARKKLEAWGIKINTLTKEQEEYLDSWQV